MTPTNQTPILHISQSLIRDMLKPEGYCGHYLNAVHVNGFRVEPTTAMIDGLVFEQHILGATSRGEHYEIPKLKNGSNSKREEDLLAAVRFAKEILEANQIVFDSVQEYIATDGRSGHIDAVGTFRGQPYIFDVKFTGMTFKQWEREYKYGDISGNFRLQALQYQSLQKQPIPFMFLVFGDNWSRFFELPWDQDAVEHHKQVAAEALAAFNAMDFRPTGDSRLCFDCPMRGECKFVNNIIEIETLFPKTL